MTEKEQSSSELLLSSYCYQQLEKEGAFTPFSISILSSPYQVVGIYQGKDLSLYEKHFFRRKESQATSITACSVTPILSESNPPSGIRRSRAGRNTTFRQKRKTKRC